MAQGDATAADCPGKYDVVLNGKGYVLADSIEPSLPFRTHRAIYDITQTFVERQNVSGAYGDQSQDFFLTASQNDWSEGEGQRFFRSNNSDSARKAWRLDNLIPTIPGQLKLEQTMPLATATIAATTAIAGSSGTGFAAVGADAANLYAFTSSSGAWSSLGAHGAGGLNAHGNSLAYDGEISGGIYIGGLTALRYYDGAAFSTFNARVSLIALAFLNNALYATDANHLYTYDTSGTETTIFTWKTAKGAAPNGGPIALAPYGGKLLILLDGLYGVGPELWIYDGTGTSVLARFPRNLKVWSLKVVNGVVFISGLLQSTVSGTTYSDPAIYYWDNGTFGLLWRAYFPTTTCSPTQIADFDSGAVWLDTSHAAADGNIGRLMYYEMASAAVSCRATLAGTPVQSTLVQVASSNTQVVVSNGQTNGQWYYPVAVATSGSVKTSLFDFDNSLTKQFRGIKVDWSAATDGDGGSVDIAYQVDSLDGSYTTLQTGAASGTEYGLSGVSGHTLGIKITVNKGTSTNGPTLKRVYVRAAPQLQQFRSGTYILDCTGTLEAPRELRDGSFHPLTGAEQAANLMTAAKATAPFSVTDKFGTFNALIDLSDTEGFDVYEVHPAPGYPAHPGSFLVRVKVREV